MALPSNYNYFIENFRGVAILFVVVSHSMVLPLIDSSRFFTFFFVDATTWFVFISGFLFYVVESNRFSYYEYLIKKAKNVVAPYAIFSLVLISFGIYTGRHEVMHLTAASYSIWSFVVGGALLGPLWYVPMAVLYFLVAPFLMRIASLKFFIVFVILGLLFSFFSSRPLYSLNPFLSALHFSGFYLLGIYVAKISRHHGFVNFIDGYSDLISFLFIGIFIFCWVWVPVDDVGGAGVLF